MAAKVPKDVERSVGSQLSSAAAPQPGDITEDMDWEVERCFVDESYLLVGARHKMLFDGPGFVGAIEPAKRRLIPSVLLF